MHVNEIVRNVYIQTSHSVFDLFLTGLWYCNLVSDKHEVDWREDEVAGCVISQWLQDCILSG